MTEKNKYLIAFVKDIPEQTLVEDEEDYFNFVHEMRAYVGQTIKVKPWLVGGIKLCKNWFQDIKSGYVYHRSWLEFVE